MTNEELLSVAEIVEKLTDRFNAQAALHRERHNEYDKLIASMNADHEAKMVEHRAAFGARTEADAKIIAGLRSEIGAARMAVLERDSLISERAKLQAMVKEQSDSAKAAGELLGWTANESPIQAVERVVRERDGLLTQVQDMRAEVDSLKREERATHDTLKPLVERITSERDALRAEVAELQERLRSSIARGDFAQMEVASLKSQNPKQHPVKVGEWVRRLVPSPACDVGTVAKVVHVDDDTSEIEYDVKRIDGQHGVWFAKNCEPCDPPQTEPVPKCAHPVAVGGYLRRLTGFNTTPAGEVARVTLVDDDDASQLEYEVVRPNGEKGRWSAKGCEPCDPPEATHAEPDLTQLHAKGKEAWSDVPNATQWVEEMRGNSEATHDTVQGKAAAVAGLPVAEEIKVGDLVEVFQKTAGSCTFKTDIGTRGTVLQLEDSCVDTAPLDGYLSPKGNHVALCDVRKVTT